MPSVGPTEVLLVLVIALLVLGPHRLPELARQLGRGIRQFREAARNVTKEMGAEDLVEDLKGLNEARGTFGQTVRKELGLDDLTLPSLDDVGTDKPATSPNPAAVAPAAAVATDAPAAAPIAPATTEAAASVPDIATPVEGAPQITVPADAPAPRKRTPRATTSPAPADTAGAAPAPRKRTAKAAATATPAKEAPATPAPRKRTPRQASVPAAGADQAPAPPSPAAPRPARKRTARPKPGESA